MAVFFYFKLLIIFIIVSSVSFEGVADLYSVFDYVQNRDIESLNSLKVEHEEALRNVFTLFKPRFYDSDNKEIIDNVEDNPHQVSRIEAILVFIDTFATMRCACADVRENIPSIEADLRGLLGVLLKGNISAIVREEQPAMLTELNSTRHDKVVEDLGQGRWSYMAMAPETWGDNEKKLNKFLRAVLDLGEEGRPKVNVKFVDGIELWLNPFLVPLFFDDKDLLEYVIKNDALYDINEKKNLSYMIKRCVDIDQYRYAMSKANASPMFLLGTEVTFPRQLFLCNRFFYKHYEMAFLLGEGRNDLRYGNPFIRLQDDDLTCCGLGFLLDRLCFGQKQQAMEDYPATYSAWRKGHTVFLIDSFNRENAVGDSVDRLRSRLKPGGYQ